MYVERHQTSQAKMGDSTKWKVTCTVDATHMGLADRGDLYCITWHLSIVTKHSREGNKRIAEAGGYDALSLSVSIYGHHFKLIHFASKD